MRPAGSGLVFASMGALYLLLALSGRATTVDAGGTALVWPAAGVALIWLLDQTERGRPARCVAALGVLTAVALASTGASAGLTLTATLASCVQTSAMVWLLRRWLPGILGTGGTGSVHTALGVAHGTAAVLVATLLGAVIGGSGLALESGSPVAMDFVSWWARNLTGAIVIGAAGHFLWEHLREEGVAHVPRPRGPELAPAVVLSAGLYGYVFTQDGLPLAFLVLPPSVWIALRFRTVFAVVHTTIFGSVAVALTVSGLGPFADIDRPEIEVIVVQAFLLTTMMTVLIIATGRDARATLAAELALSERAATERADLFDAMAEAMTEGLAVVAEDGSVIRMNSACQALLAHTPAGSAAHSTAYELRYPDGTAMPSSEYPFARALREGQVDPHDVHLVLGDGQVRILSVTASRLSSDGVPGALVVFREVTRERLDRSELAAFAGTAAHDLLSPLTAIQAWLELSAMQLQRLMDVPASEPLRDELEAVGRGIAQGEKSTSRMGRLIHELLLQATAEGRELELMPVPLSGDGGLVTEVAELLPGCPEVLVGSIPPVLGDVELLRQLLGNLLGNAVKYADPERPSRITVTGERVGRRVLIEVIDNGIGVPADQRQSVFDRFHRAHASDSRFTGTGLGLALCRTVVERHDGIIECLSPVDGVGSRFRFDLAAAEQHADALTSVAASPESSRSS